MKTPIERLEDELFGIDPFDFYSEAPANPDDVWNLDEYVPELSRSEAIRAGKIYRKIKALVEARGLTFATKAPYKSRSLHGTYSPFFNILYINQNRPMAHKLGTIAHEFTHALRLPTIFHVLTAISEWEEFVAQGVSAMILDTFGFDTYLYSAYYMQQLGMREESLVELWPYLKTDLLDNYNKFMRLLQVT